MKGHYSHSQRNPQGKVRKKTTLFKVHFQSSLYINIYIFVMIDEEDQ